MVLGGHYWLTPYAHVDNKTNSCYKGKDAVEMVSFKLLFYGQHLLFYWQLITWQYCGKVIVVIYS